jgi:hypothetical protein
MPTAPAADRQIALAFADMLVRPSADHSVMALTQKARLEPIRIHGALCARDRMFANGRAPANADEACGRYARREDIFS